MQLPVAMATVYNQQPALSHPAQNHSFSHFLSLFIGVKTSVHQVFTAAAKSLLNLRHFLHVTLGVLRLYISALSSSSVERPSTTSAMLTSNAN